jgi:hypothetical protein
MARRSNSNTDSEASTEMREAIQRKKRGDKTARKQVQAVLPYIRTNERTTEVRSERKVDDNPLADGRQSAYPQCIYDSFESEKQTEEMRTNS